MEAHADRIVDAARRGVRFDLDDISDAARLMAALRDGDGPARVSAERIWALLPHIPEEDAELAWHKSDTVLGSSLQTAPALIDPRLPLAPESFNEPETAPGHRALRWT